VGATVANRKKQKKNLDYGGLLESRGGINKGENQHKDSRGGPERVVKTRPNEE